ncbi:MAG TPA: hypothetical protein VEB86_17130 [Chryseosolibacter sp.]|nr:hypothetical protein [Chryseosolibacter sp.]
MRMLDRAFILAGLISLSVLIGISSCERKGETDGEGAKRALEATIEKDAWRVTYFYDGDDRTSYFSGTTFQFLNNGGIVASCNKTTINGVWTAVDGREGEIRFNLLFNERVPFRGLDRQWVVVERTESRVSLEAMNDDGNRMTLEKV